MEIEFLISELGRGKNEPYKVKELNINAQGLRYLNLLQKYTIEILFYDINLVVPEPAAFVLHKFIVSDRRQNQTKREKDIKTAK